MIDLHTHTTASDGWCDPRELIRRARDAGLHTIAVTDHDTMAATAAAREAATEAGLRFVAGIEITAIDRGDDVHMLGYFLDHDDPRLREFLVAQRQDRIRRLREMAERLASLGCRIDIDRVVSASATDGGRSVGRPLLARALVEAGHAQDTNDAFARWLARGCPAFVPRTGASPSEVVAIIHDAGGLASMAHPAKTGRDDLIPTLVAHGLDAIEAHHPDHTPGDTARYGDLARALNLVVSGGSDYHGHEDHGGQTLGAVTIDDAQFDQLIARARSSGRAGL